MRVEKAVGEFFALKNEQQVLAEQRLVRAMLREANSPSPVCKYFVLKRTVVYCIIILKDACGFFSKAMFSSLNYYYQFQCISLSLWWRMESFSFFAESTL